jgi:hypothetical protein
MKVTSVSLIGFGEAGWMHATAAAGVGVSTLIRTSVEARAVPSRSDLRSVHGI